MKFSEKLKLYRKESNLTQEKLAKQLNVSRSLVARWEFGDVYPKLEILKELSNVLNVPLTQLIDEEEKTHIEVEHLNFIKNMNKNINLFIWISLTVYRIVTVLMFGLKMFSMEGNATYVPGGPASKIYVFSVLDVIYLEDIWLLIITVILNIGIIIVSSINHFKKDINKNIFKYILLGLFLVSLTFFIITLKVGTKDPSSLWQFK